MMKGRGDVEFYTAAARRGGEGQPVLELGCGTGRVLLPIARAGVRITGLDQSKAMLERAREKLAQEPADVQECVRLVEGDMTKFSLGEKFQLVTIPFRAFQHLLRVEQQLACLGCIHRHLADEGKLILDFFQTDPRRMFDPAFQVESARLPEVTLGDGRKVQLTDRVVEYHRAEQWNEVEMNFYVTHTDGRLEKLVHAFSVRYFFPFEVEHLLARCGFRVTNVYGGFDCAPLGDTSADMIFVAEKSAVAPA
jgi:ubiquinone/menaquinone biosynthesis C-methylase UbiE